MQAMIQQMSKPQIATPTRPVVRVMGYMPIAPVIEKNRQFVRLILGVQFPDNVLQYELPLELTLEQNGNGMGIGGVQLKYPTQPLNTNNCLVSFPWACVKLPNLQQENNGTALVPQQKAAALPTLIARLSTPAQASLFTLVEKVVNDREKLSSVGRPTTATAVIPSTVAEVRSSASHITLRKRKASNSLADNLDAMTIAKRR